MACQRRRTQQACHLVAVHFQEAAPPVRPAFEDSFRPRQIAEERPQESQQELRLIMRAWERQIGREDILGRCLDSHRLGGQRREHLEPRQLITL